MNKRTNLITDDSYEEALRAVRGENPNIEKARILLEEAFQQGDPRAAYALGTWYFHGKVFPTNKRIALKLFRYAAKKCVPIACFDLAVCFERGCGVRRSFRSAFSHYLQAALLGDKESVYEVGRCYYYGIGTKKDRKQAIMWLDYARDVKSSLKKPKRAVKQSSNAVSSILHENED